MRKKLQKVFSFFLRFGLSVILILFLFRKFDLHQVLTIIRNADMHFLALAIFYFTTCNILLLLRWAIIIRALDMHIPFSHVTLSFFIGLFFNLFLPSSAGGDVARSVNLFSRTQHKARAVTSVVIDRLSGFISLILICGVSLILGYKYVNDSTVYLVMAVFLFILAAMILVLFSRRVFTKFSRIFARAPHIVRQLMNLNEAFIMFRNRYGAIVISIFISITSQMLFFLMSYYIVRSFHAKVGLIYFLIFMPIISFLTSLPISLGGLGVRDASSIYFFSKIGLGSSTALGLSLMNFVFLVAIGLIGGILYVFTLSPRRLQHRQTSSQPQK